MGTSVDGPRAEGGARRLHPSSLLFDAGRRLASLIFWAVAVLFFAAKSEEGWYLLFLLPPLLEALVRYASFRYSFAPDELVVREGWLTRSVRHVPYARVQNIDTVQGPLHRLLGVVEVRLETASGKEPEAVFRVITGAHLAELRARVFAEAHPARTADEAFARAEGEGGGAFFRMRTGDVLFFGLLEQRGLVFLGGLLVLLREVADLDGLRERLEPGLAEASEGAAELAPWVWLVLLLGAFALLQLGSLLWAYLTLHGFQIERRGEDLRTTCGLLTRQTASLPRARVQCLEVRQGLLQRCARRAALRATSAGADSTRASQVARKWLVPLCRVDELPAILGQVQPEADFQGASWQGVHPRASRRLGVRMGLVLLGMCALLAIESWVAAAGAGGLGGLFLVWLARRRARALGWALSAEAVFVRSGAFARRQTCVRFAKIQSLDLRRSPLDRRARMAHLVVDTAGASGSGRFVIPFLPVRVALRLRRTLGRAAARAAFTW
jgi:putative membrane protein